MQQIGNNDFEIQLFGQKLMSSSKSINKVPEEYLNYSQNARIYDGGIGPRKGMMMHMESNLGTNNKGAFIINKKMYQIANGKIYEITEKGTQIEIVDLGYDANTSIKVHNSKIALIVSEGQNIRVFNGNSILESATGTVVRIKYNGLIGGNTIQRNWLMMGMESGAIGTIIKYENGIITLSLDGDIQLVMGEGLKIAPPDTTNYVEKVEKITELEVDKMDGGVIEIALNRTFVAKGNVLYIGAEIETHDMSTAYKFNGKNMVLPLTFSSKIVALRRCMSGLYIFTEDSIELFDYSSVTTEDLAGQQTVLMAKTKFIGDGGILAGKDLIVTVGDLIYYCTKGGTIATLGYIEGTSTAGIGSDISSVPIIGIKDFLTKLDLEQDTGFAYHNQREGNIQFFLKIYGSSFNNICVIYDLFNNTWNIDTNRNYNRVLYYKGVYYGFSDINTSIYRDCIGVTDNGNPIDFRIVSQSYNFQTSTEKLFQGFFCSGIISPTTDLRFKVYIDSEIAYDNIINGTQFKKDQSPILELDDFLETSLGLVGGYSIGDTPIGGNISDRIEKYAFDIKVDSGNINISGQRINIEISSKSLISEFLIDILGFIKTDTGYVGQSKKV